MLKIVPLLIVSLWAVIADAAPLRIALIGDSTVSDYPVDSTVMRGWGQLLPEFLESEVVIMNEAQSGASTKTFPAERWQKVLSERPDFVLIQFGHNDSHEKGRPESTDANTDYRDNLRRYIQEAREAGITPVMVTPVHRRLFANSVLRRQQKLLAYAEAMKVVATELSVPLIDLYESSGVLFASLGEDGSDAFTMNHLERDDSRASDRTHFTETGAREIARLVVKELPQVDPKLEAAVRK